MVFIPGEMMVGVKYSNVSNVISQDPGHTGHTGHSGDQVTTLV